MTVTDATFAGTLPAIQRTQDHRYCLSSEGKWYPGVTTALKVFKDVNPFIWWASNETSDAAIALMESRETLDTLMGSVGPDGIKKALMNRANWKRDEAAHLGTKVHTWADRFVNMGELPALSDTERLYTEHYAEWWKRSGLTLRLSEALVIAPATYTEDPPQLPIHEGWGGTFDLLCYDEAGKTVLADIKTGKGVYRETILQLAAYGMAPLVSPMGSGDVFPMPQVDRYMVIHVTREGVRPIDVNIGPREWAAWLACLDLYNWSETVKGKL